MSCEEVYSVESLLEKAQKGLDERELSELKRILYGRPAEYVSENKRNNIPYNTSKKIFS